VSKSKTKKRKAESPISGDAEGSDAHQPDYDYSSINDNYSFDTSRSAKLRVGDLKLPFSLASGNSGNSNKRQRAISAPSPITPSFFNNFTTSGFVNGHEQETDAGVAPFGMTGSSSYGTHLQPYIFPSVFNQPTQIPKYEFPSPATTYQHIDETSSGRQQQHLSSHHLPLPALVTDVTPQSGATDSTFALETPRTIYSGANASARPGTANSINSGGSLDVRSSSFNNLKRSVPEENKSVSDLLLNYSSGSAHENANIKGEGEGQAEVEREVGNKSAEVIPGPEPAYVFPLTQKPYDDPGQTKRVFVNPSGTTTTTITPSSMPIPSSTTAMRNSPNQPHRNVGVPGNALNISNILNSNNTMTSTSNSSSNPFAVPHAPSHEDSRNRPAALSLNDKQGQQFFSPPSATSPSRHLPTEYDNMFSTAPFGMVFDAPSSKGSSPRKGSFFSGLTAR